MATATKAKTATDELAKLEAERDEIRQELKKQRHEHYAIATATADLQKQRRRLIDRDPDLTDFHHQPLPEIDDNPIAKIDQELAELGSVEEAYARAQHLGHREGVADRRVRECIETHSGELLEQLHQSDAGATAAEWARAVQALRAAGSEVLALLHRSEQLGQERLDSRVDALQHVLSVLEGIETVND